MTTAATSNSHKKPRRLGRGLSSLLGEPVLIESAQVADADTVSTDESPKSATSTPNSDGGLLSLPVLQIVPNRFQPRRSFSDDALDRLAQSIRTAGVMQPVVVRPLEAGADAPAGAKWELIAGERRWRAAQRADLKVVPAVVAELSDQDAAEWSLVENLQREDLNPMERAHAFDRLVEDFGLTQAQVASRVGLERSTVANLIRLTELEELIQDEITAGRLTAGHGKALLTLSPGKGRTQLAIHARDGEWSVRRLEQHIHRLNSPSDLTATGRLGSPENSLRAAAKKDLERRVRDRLGTKVSVHLDAAGLRGRMVIEFYDPEQLEGVLTKMGVSPDSVR